MALWPKCRGETRFRPLVGRNKKSLVPALVGCYAAIVQHLTTQRVSCPRCRVDQKSALCAQEHPRAYMRPWLLCWCCSGQACLSPH
ncbi:hypothetical protein JG688_00015354 [Phytophthora aleatoria]|uniref:Uncharacterized protein n=1 Tax=Phytophthora aleatoria TaxID=2496075 RepID=A0A8J5I618_9STRA|nr:hypothetical protein JG688_00015354 [Phytophthora aleatoria]